MELVAKLIIIAVIYLVFGIGLTIALKTKVISKISTLECISIALIVSGIWVLASVLLRFIF